MLDKQVKAPLEQKTGTLTPNKLTKCREGEALIYLTVHNSPHPTEIKLMAESTWISEPLVIL